jgi:hypothetical protein
MDILAVFIHLFIWSSFRDYLVCSQRIVMKKCGEQTAKFTEDVLNQMSFSLIQVWIYFNTCIVFHFILWSTNGKFNVHVSVRHRNNTPIHIQQDSKLHSLFYLETSLHVSGGTITHHQERRTKASSKASSLHSAIQSFLLQMRVSSPFLKVTQ